MIGYILAAAKIVVVGLFLLGGLVAHSAEIKVLSVVPLKVSLDELGPQFERATGHKLIVNYAGSSDLLKQFDAGEAFDVALVPGP